MKHRQVFSIGLVATIIISSLVLTVADNYTTASAAVPVIGELPSSATPGDGSYALFFIGGGDNIYRLDTTSIIKIAFPNALDSALQNSIDFTKAISWSEHNRAFLLNLNTDLYRLPDGQSLPIPLGVKNPGLHVFSGEWSPDGKSIALNAAYFDPNDYTRNYNYLAVISPDQKLHVLTNTTTNDIFGFPLIDPTLYATGVILGLNSTPHWSPDGKWIAFTQYNSPDLYLLDTSCVASSVLNCAIRTIKPSETDQVEYSNVAWLPDSTHLMFDCVTTLPTPTSLPANSEGDNSQVIPDVQHDLCTVGIDGYGLTHLSLPGTGLNAHFTFALSPDGKTLAYTQTADLNRSITTPLFIYDLSANRLIKQIPIPGLAYMTWVSTSAAQALAHMPPPPPSTIVPLNAQNAVKATPYPTHLPTLTPSLTPTVTITPTFIVTPTPQH